MPCWDSKLQAEEYRKKERADHQEKCSRHAIEHLESRIHNLTEMLCFLCRRVESAWPSVFLENTELSAWWKDHKANDKVIKEIEQIRSQIEQLEELEKSMYLKLESQNQNP